MRSVKLPKMGDKVKCQSEPQVGDSQPQVESSARRHRAVIGGG